MLDLRRDRGHPEPKPKQTAAWRKTTATKPWQFEKINMVTPQRQTEGQTGFTPKMSKARNQTWLWLFLVNSISPRIIKRLFLTFFDFFPLFRRNRKYSVPIQNSNYIFFIQPPPLPPLNCLTIILVGVLIVVIEGIHV